MPFGVFRGSTKITKAGAVAKLLKPKKKKLDSRVARALRVLKPETKHVGFDYNTAVPLDENVVANNQINVFIVDRGAAPQNRIGNKIRAMRIVLRGSLRNVDRANQAFPSLVRISLVMDKRSNKQRFGLDDLRTITDGKYLEANSLRNEENVKRFKILYDKVMIIGGMSGTAAIPNYDTNRDTHKFFSSSISLGKTGTVITYDNDVASGASTNCESGTIWLLVKAEGSANLVTGPSLDLHGRLYYTDV